MPRRSLIKKHYAGFVPAHMPHDLNLCAFYHCSQARYDNRRYCYVHAEQYDKEANQSDHKVLEFVNA